jgi:hypothetical protein
MMLLALLLAPDRLLLRKAATNPDVSERVRDHVGQSRKLDRAIAKLRRKVWWDAGLHLPINSRRGLGYQFAGPAEIDIASDRQGSISVVELAGDARVVQQVRIANAGCAGRTCRRFSCQREEEAGPFARLRLLLWLVQSSGPDNVLHSAKHKSTQQQKTP